jgi:streptogramin lyase
MIPHGEKAMRPRSPSIFVGLFLLLWGLAGCAGSDATSPAPTPAPTPGTTPSPTPIPTGTVIEFPIPDKNFGPYKIEPGPDGNLWFDGLCPNEVGPCSPASIAKITPAGTFTEFVVPSVVDITVGPDGNIWFVTGTVSAQPSLGNMTTTGTVQTFSARAPSFLLTAGPDGNLWVETEFSLDVYSTAGVLLHSFPTNLPPASTVQSLVVGPDNNIWFDANNQTPAGLPSPFVVRMTLAGVATTFPLSQIPDVEGMTAGPDGNLWLCSQGGGKIGRLTTSGSLTLFALPVASEPLRIATGPDGNLWFTQFAGNIGRITPGGAVTEFPIGADRIATGPDGFVWFTQNQAGIVGKIHP